MKKLILLMIIPFTLFAFHKYENTQDEHDHHTQRESLEETLTSAEPFLKSIYDNVNKLAKNVDEFISQDKTPMVYDDSYVHIEGSFYKAEGASSKFTGDIDIKLRLKKTKKRLRLVIDNNDNQVNDDFSDHNETVTYKDDDYNIGLQYEAFKEYINFKARLGVKVSTNPYIFAKVTALKEFHLSQSSSIKIDQKFKYSERNKLDSTSTMSYIKDLDPIFTFINLNQYYINSEQKVDNLYNSLRINQKINERDYFNYVLSLESNNSDTSLREKVYRGYLVYRDFIKKWIYYDLIPETNFQHVNNFETEFAFRFNIGIIIGK